MVDAERDAGSAPRAAVRDASRGVLGIRNADPDMNSLELGEDFLGVLELIGRVGRAEELADQAFAPVLGGTLAALLGAGRRMGRTAETRGCGSGMGVTTVLAPASSRAKANFCCAP